MELITTKYQSNDIIINEVHKDDKDGRLLARSKIEKVEQIMMKVAEDVGNEMDDINNNGLKEHYAGGSYIRELFIPKDKVIVSRIWSKERFWIIASGEVTFTTEMGTQRVKAPFTKVVPHGSKVALYTHTDVLWYAITGAKATNSKDIEKEVTVDDYSQCIYEFDKGELK